MIKRLDGLDALRGFAALAVVVCHVYFLTDLPMPKAFGVTAGHFALAVELFFILSAFSLCVGYFWRLSTPSDLKSYALRRFFRIAPLFYFFIGVWTLYRHFHHATINPSDILKAATFTFSLFPSANGGYVAAGWSIGVEMIFYILLPVILFYIRDLRSGVITLCVALALGAASDMAIATYYPKIQRINLLVQLPMFAVGLVCFFAYQRMCRWDDTRLAIFAASAFLFSIAFWATLFLVIGKPAGIHGGNSFWWRMCVCLPFPGLLLAFALAPIDLLVNRVTVLLGTYSYGIYLWHSFVIVTTAEWRRTIFAPDVVGGLWPSLVLSCATVAALSILAAACTYHALEAPFQRLSIGTARPAKAP